MATDLALGRDTIRKVASNSQRKFRLKKNLMAAAQRRQHKLDAAKKDSSNFKGDVSDRKQKRMKWTNKFADADKKRGVEIRDRQEKQNRLKKKRPAGDGDRNIIRLDPREMDGSLGRRPDSPNKKFRGSVGGGTYRTMPVNKLDGMRAAIGMTGRKALINKARMSNQTNIQKNKALMDKARMATKSNTNVQKNKALMNAASRRFSQVKKSV